MLHFEIFTTSAAWISLLTLSFLEIILGIDNIIFISIITGKLPKEEQRKGRLIGLALALIMRIILLFGIAYLASLTQPLFTIFEAGFSGRDLILLGGGLFLIYKSTVEIHEKIEPNLEEKKNVKAQSLNAAIVQIILIDLVFSFDSILTAVGMTTGLTGALMVMIIAVVISVLIMMLFAVPVGRFVNQHPTIQMLGLAFLILIGFMLIVEGAHMAHLTIAGSEVGAVPKGYLYFAIAFSLLVEFLNMKLRKKRTPIQLHGITEEAKAEGLLNGGNQPSINH